MINEIVEELIKGYTIVWGTLIFLLIADEIKANWKNFKRKDYWLDKLHCSTCRTFWVSTLFSMDLRVSIAITSINLMFDWYNANRDVKL